MRVAPAYIADLVGKGWQYLGKCPCVIPKDKFVKGDYTLKIERRHGSWELLKNKMQQKIGSKDDLTQLNEI